MHRFWKVNFTDKIVHYVFVVEETEDKIHFKELAFNTHDNKVTLIFNNTYVVSHKAFSEFDLKKINFDTVFLHLMRPAEVAKHRKGLL